MKRQKVKGDETMMLLAGKCTICKISTAIRMYSPIDWATMSQEDKDNLTYICVECTKK